MGVWADSLIAELDALKAWPPPAHRNALQRVSRGIAMRERDREALRSMAGWDEGRRATQRFVVDPMPGRISAAFQGLIFGRAPVFEAAAEADQLRLDDVVKENNFRSELARGARTASSEGEVWWRLYVDRDVADHPLVEWYSRTAVYPSWRSGRLLALAFVSRLEDHDGFEWRHFEVHDHDREKGGAVQHVLYRRAANRAEDAATGSSEGRGAPDTRLLATHRTEGDRRGLGDRVSLNTHPETKGTQELWQHGLPGALGGRVTNLIESDPTIGVSDYWAIEDYLTELNIAASIASANMELTARRRVIVPETQAAETGAVDVGEQVYTEGSGLNAQMGEAGGRSGAPFKVLEYSFDAEALIAYKREIERTALNRQGIDAQYAGIDPAEGSADTGVALRIKLIPSVAAGDDRAQDWDHQLPRVARLLQLLEALPVDAGGFGRPWQKPDEAPSVERGSTLPEDRTEATDRRSEAVAAGIMSRRTAVEEDHPDWDEELVEDELGRIEKDRKKEAPSFGAVGAPPDEEAPSPSESFEREAGELVVPGLPAPPGK